MKYLIFLYLLISPCFYWIGKPLRTAQEILFNISAIAIIFVSLLVKNNPVSSERKFTNINIWIGIFGLYTLGLYLISRCTMGSNVLFNLLFGVLIYHVCIRTLTKSDTELLLKAIALVCIINGAFIALQLINWDPFFCRTDSVNDSDYMGFFGLKAAMGQYFALAMPLVACLSPWLPLLFFIPLAISVSTGAFLAGYIGYTVFLWFRHRKASYAMMILGLIASVLFIIKIDAPMGMYKTRIPMWRKVLHDSSRSPIIGYGLDSFRTGNLRYFHDPKENKTERAISQDGKTFKIEGEKDRYDFWDNAHNSFIMIFFEMGFIGLGLVAVWLYAMRKRVLNNINKYSVGLFAFFVAFCVCGMTQFPDRIARIAHLLPVMLALFYLNTERADA